ncbi:MAG: 2Fe-2S iron-sulfur cluster binding domain-containing protein [Chlorobi bacterium]|nr:2Fe-2S iron-sulfur cluster binding domain-containing protein [Chlorobiota bacterium]
MIAFILNNKTIKTHNNAGMTLLDFVRYEQRLTGTKIGCREGDCGACTVLVGTLNEKNTISYKSITSCISPLGNAHGKHIVTIEGTNLPKELTVTQSAIKENHASQCGFCTPGFVVSLTGFALSESKNNSENALDAISGNICRCTGYKSIEKAVDDICEKLESADSKKSLQTLIDNGFIPSYFSEIPERLNQLQIKSNPQSGMTYVSGGTDLYVQKADNLINNTVHLISDDDSLKGIHIDDNICTIGAGTTVTDLWNHKALNTVFPNLKKHLKLVSSEQIRNMASLGGNFVNASPIGDMTIFFLALNSNITIINPEGNERQIPLNQFYKGYKTFDLKDDELIKDIQFELPSRHTKFNFEKVSKRTHLDIASVNSAISITVKNNSIEDAYVSIGGVSAIPKYLFKTSTFLNGKPLNKTTILEANEILQSEISPISDVRGSSDYKRLLARQLFFAHFTALFSHQFSLNDFVQHA